MSEKGAKPTICDCPYTDWCEDTRQWLRQEFRRKGTEKTVQDCDFYEMIEKKNDLNTI